MIPATAASREQLLSACFADCPQTVAGLPLRPLSAKSFTLLGELGNPMVGEPLPGTAPMSTLDAVIQYLWIHSAPLDTVAAIQTPADLPQKEIRKLGFQIDLPTAFGFLRQYQASAARMSAALAHIAPEDEEDTLGKPAAENPPAPHGSPPSSSPSAVPQIPPGSVTSSGSCPSSAPSPISTLPTSPPEPIASGPVPLPELPPSHPLSQMQPPPSAPSSSATPSVSSP